MNRLLRAWQLAILLNGLPRLQSFISHSARTRHSNIAPELKSLVRSFSSRFGYEKSEELSRLEEIEFYLYTDSIDRKLMQSEFSDPFSSSSRGIISSRGSIKDSSHLNRDSLQLMLRKETENAVRAVSMFGGLLSVIISRDIWYAASSFLIMNIFATQSNGIGTITRITGARIDLLMREIMKIVRLLSEFCFKGEIERNSFREVSGYSFSNPRSTRTLGKKVKPDFEPILDDDYEYEDENVIDAEREEEESEKKKVYGRLDSVISAVTVDPIVENKKHIKAKESVVQPAIPPSSSVKVLNILTPPVNRAVASAGTSGSTAVSSYNNSSSSSSSNNGAISTTNPSRIPLGTLISSAAKSAVTHKLPLKPAATVLPSPSAVYAATTPLSGKTTSSGIGVISESVVNATIEVQAAADAAAERLKSWLLQQRKVEELKRREKIVNLLEQNRGKDSSLKRKSLLLDLALFITSNDANAEGSDKNNNSNNIDYNTADKKTNNNNNNNNNSNKNKNSATTSTLTSTSTSTSTSKSSDENVDDVIDESEGKTFSKLSIEFEVGSIHDFVAVLVSPGKTDLFSRK